MRKSTKYVYHPSHDFGALEYDVTVFVAASLRASMRYYASTASTFLLTIWKKFGAPRHFLSGVVGARTCSKGAFDHVVVEKRSCKKAKP